MYRSDFLVYLFFLALCLVAICLSVSSWKSYETPETIPVPISEANKTSQIVFPSDNNYAGGPPYLFYKGMSLETLPANAYCKPTWSQNRNHFAFDCAWKDVVSEYQYARTNVYLLLPNAKGVEKWSYNQDNLTLVATMRPWAKTNFWSLAVIVLATIIAAFFVFAVIMESTEHGWAALKKG